MDVHTRAQRSFNMSRIRGKDTSPEMLVRRLLHSLGYGYKLHVRDLPGRPDIVLPKHRLVIFVHGCFWHMHKCRFGRVTPRTNADFWQKKRTGNVARDKKNAVLLRRAGWRVLNIWECSCKNSEGLQARLAKFFA